MLKRPVGLKRCLRCGHPIDPALDVGPYRSRKRHPLCAELEKRDAVRRTNEERRQKTLERRAQQLAQPAGLATRKPRWVLPPPRNPRGCPLVEALIRAVDAGIPDDSARARRLFGEMARQYGEAS